MCWWTSIADSAPCMLISGHAVHASGAPGLGEDMHELLEHAEGRDPRLVLRCALVPRWEPTRRELLPSLAQRAKRGTADRVARGGALRSYQQPLAAPRPGARHLRARGVRGRRSAGAGGHAAAEAPRPIPSGAPPAVTGGRGLDPRPLRGRPRWVACCGPSRPGLILVGFSPRRHGYTEILGIFLRASVPPWWFALSAPAPGGGAAPPRA